jgi:hypothetical protein
MPGSDRSADLLQLLKAGQVTPGLKIINVNTTDPFPLSFIFEGTKQALDAPIFEIPVDFYPFRQGDRLLAYPMVGKGASQRWGVIQKLNGGVVFGTMKSANSLAIDGIDHTYTSDVLIIPPYFAVGSAQANGYLLAADSRPLQAGDRVSVKPTGETGKIKYVITQKY